MAEAQALAKLPRLVVTEMIRESAGKLDAVKEAHRPLESIRLFAALKTVAPLSDDPTVSLSTS